MNMSCTWSRNKKSELSSRCSTFLRTDLDQIQVCRYRCFNYISRIRKCHGAHDLNCIIREIQWELRYLQFWIWSRSVHKNVLQRLVSSDFSFLDHVHDKSMKLYICVQRCQLFVGNVHCHARQTGHRFPTNPERLKKWLIAIRREHFTPTKNSRVCKNHFRPQDYEPAKDPSFDCNCKYCNSFYPIQGKKIFLFYHRCVLGVNICH